MDRLANWMTPERSIALQGLGTMFSQLDAGQPVNLSGAHQALAIREQNKQQRQILQDSGIMQRFDPQQRALLMSMEPAAAQKIIAQTMFGNRPEPVKGVNINGRLVNPVTGALIADYSTPEPAPKRPTAEGADGFLYYLDGDKERVFPEIAEPPKPTGYIVTGPQAEALGLDPENSYNVTVEDGSISASQIGGGGVNVENNLGDGADDAFLKGAAGAQVKIFSNLMEQGLSAQGNMAQLRLLGPLLEDVGGTTDAWRSWAQNTFGINVSGGKIEALNAALSKLVPNQRPPGSGTTSDADLRLYRESLPQLINSEEGNRIIYETMMGMAQLQQQQGDIAAGVLMGDISRADGLRMLRDLPDPMAQARARIEALNSDLPDKEDILNQARKALGE